MLKNIGFYLWRGVLSVLEIVRNLWAGSWHPKAPPRPMRLAIGRKREIDMASFGYTFALPPASAPDVVTQEVSVTVDDGDPEARSYPAADTTTDEFVFSVGASVSAVLTDIDGAGNRSPTSGALTFTVNDDVPPPAPSGLGIASKRQID